MLVFFKCTAELLWCAYSLPITLLFLGADKPRLDSASLDEQQCGVGEPPPEAEGRLAATAREQLRGQRAQHHLAAVRRAEVATVWMRELLTA